MDNDTNAGGVAIESTPLLAAAVELLRVAKCPECDGCGFTVRETGGCDMDGENDTRECVQEQCRWCFERNGLLAEYDTANMWLLFNHARAVEEQLESLLRLVADDAWAATFQSLGQYRTALLREIDTDSGQEQLRCKAE